MSEAVRAVALSEAIKFNAGNSTDPSAVVKTAGVFLTFLSGTAAPAKTSTAAGAEPAAKQEGKPSASTAGAKAATKPAATTKPKKPTEQELAAAALEKANAEAEAEGETGASEQTEPLEPTPEGVALAVKLLIEDGKRDDAIALLKKHKAASVTSMQKKPEETIIEFIDAVNELLGLGGEPSVD